MRIDIVTLFPEVIEAAVSFSILGRAREAGIVEITAVNLRDYATDRHRTVDDTPVGGGGGMILKIEPIAAALDALQKERPARVILMDPRGERFTQRKAVELAGEDRLILLCGHYEGVDERVREHLVSETLSIGDFVLTGGELPALVIVDAVARLLPGALGEEQAPHKDTFSESLLEYPQYTRPRAFRGWEVPEILLSGHHDAIRKWRRWQQLHRTREERPDLWARFAPTKEDLLLLESEEPRAPSESRPKKEE